METTHPSTPFSERRSETSPVIASRRAVLGASAFTVPAVALSVAVPAYASSGDTVSATVSQPRVARGGSAPVRVTVGGVSGASAGRLVTITASDAAATLAQSSGVTDSSGVFATRVSVSEGSTAGTVTLTATCDGTTGTAAFSYAAPGSPAWTAAVGGRPHGSAVSPDNTQVALAAGDSLTIRRASDGSVIRTVASGGVPVTAVFSPDGSFVATITVNNGSQYSQSVVTISTSSSGTVKQLVVPEGVGVSIACSPDGSTLYAMVRADDTNGTIVAIDSTTLTRLWSVGVGTWAMKMAMSPDGSALYVVRSQWGPSVVKVSTVSQAVVGSAPLGSVADNSPPTTLVVSPDGSLVYVGLMYHLMEIDAAQMVVSRTVGAPGSGIQDIATWPNGPRLYYVDFHSSLYRVEPSTLSVALVSSTSATQTNTDHPGLSLSPDGTRAYVALNNTNQLRAVDL